MQINPESWKFKKEYWIFVEQYQCHFGNAENEKFSYMYNISGSDAYAPMLVAAEHDECYLKMINSLFDLQVNVN